MTLNLIENTLGLLQALLNSLQDQINRLATKMEVASLLNSIIGNSQDISTIRTQVTDLLTSIGLVNKVSRLIDVNIDDIQKDDLLQFDGDRWTNIRPSKLGVISGDNNEGSATSETRLSLLADVSISSVQNGQALIWDNSSGRWVNSTIVSSGGSTTSGITVTEMWLYLASATSETINPTHIKGELKVTSVETSANVIAHGSVLSDNEVTAYT